MRYKGIWGRITHMNQRLRQGTPNRHPATSIFNSEEGGNVLRAAEIKEHWINKGERLIEVSPGVWIDPGF